VDVFEKSPWEYDLNHKTSSFLIWQLKNTTGLYLQNHTQSGNSQSMNDDKNGTFGAHYLAAQSEQGPNLGDEAKNCAWSSERKN
jgi:hypothetical protein